MTDATSRSNTRLVKVRLVVRPLFQAASPVLVVGDSVEMVEPEKVFLIRKSFCVPT